MIHLAHHQIKVLMEEKSARKNDREETTSGSQKVGGIALKFVSPSYVGMPDRLLLFPDGKIAFAELKAPKKKLRALQEARHKLLRSLGFQVYVINSVEQIGGMIDELHAS